MRSASSLADRDAHSLGIDLALSSIEAPAGSSHLDSHEGAVGDAVRAWDQPGDGRLFVGFSKRGPCLSR